MRFSSLLLSIVFLGLLGAVGHDMYLWLSEEGAAFQLTELGFLWTRYAPTHYNEISTAMDPVIWGYLTLLLEQKTIIVFAVLTIILAVSRHIFKFLFIGQPEEEGKKTKRGRAPLQRRKDIPLTAEEKFERFKSGDL